MIGLIIRAAIGALGLWLATKIVPGVRVTSLGSLVAAALLLGIANALVRPVVVLLTLPLTIVTLGLFLLVVNGLMVWLVSALLGGFKVDSLLAAIGTSLVVWVTGVIASALVPR
ncbi:MAG: phage holin family protein [Caulobacteraceae bacterium]